MINNRLCVYRDTKREIEGELQNRGLKEATTDQLLRTLTELLKLIRNDEKMLSKNGKKRR